VILSPVTLNDKKSRAIRGKTMRCRCKFQYISHVRFPCHSSDCRPTAFWLVFVCSLQ